MEESQEPFTQAIESTSSGSMPVLNHPGTVVNTPAAIVATSSSTTVEDLQAVAAQQQQGHAGSTQTDVAMASSQIPLDSQDSIQVVPSQPIVLTGFAAAQSLAAAKPVPVPYTEPPVELPQPPTTTLLPASLSGPQRIITDEEVQKMGPDQARLALKEPGTMSEDAVRALSVSELKKFGLGRTPSGFCYSSRMTLHRELENVAKGETHPEQPARVSGIFNKLQAAGLTTRMERVAVREAVREEVMLVHSGGHWDRVRATGFQTIDYLASCSEYFERLSLYVNQETAICARLSCGGVIEMCKAVAEGQIRNGFAIVRPPGHHAEPEDAMGFCFFNNVAVAAKWLRTIYDGQQQGSNGQPVKKMDKILILDWDVHHGNGTQKAFWDDPNVLYISIHRHGDGFYPGGTYGAAEMVGEGAGTGFSVNIPFPDTGMGDTDYLYAFQQVVMPIAYEFNPDMVLVSAGYDAADGDLLGQMKVTPAGFAHMTHMLSVLANGKLVLALEGGYNVDAIVKSAHACVEVLVGDEPRGLQLTAASMSATNAVQEVIKVQSRHWKCMGLALEPTEELKSAGKIVPVSELLKAHRVYELYNEYELFNVEFSDPELERAYKDQLLCSPNVYEAETLLVFMHDIGSIKANFTAATLDVDLERTLLLDTSREVLDWAMRENDWGVIDVNLLAHLPTVKGQAPDRNRDTKREQQLALFIWDNIAQLSEAQNIILFGSGAGCAAMMAVISGRAGAVRERVCACISVLGQQAPPELDAASGSRSWYKERSLVMLPSTHPLHEDARKAGKHQKKYGNVYRGTAEDEGRPIHLLQASLPRIQQFVNEKLPAPRPKVASNGEVQVPNSNSGSGASALSRDTASATGGSTGGDVEMVSVGSSL